MGMLVRESSSHLADLARRVRRLEIRAKRLVAERLLGPYGRVFRGRALAFSPGRDDPPGGDPPRQRAPALDGVTNEQGDAARISEQAGGPIRLDLVEVGVHPGGRHFERAEQTMIEEGVAKPLHCISARPFDR